MVYKSAILLFFVYSHEQLKLNPNSSKLARGRLAALTCDHSRTIILSTPSHDDFLEGRTWRGLRQPADRCDCSRDICSLSFHQYASRHRKGEIFLRRAKNANEINITLSIIFSYCFLCSSYYIHPFRWAYFLAELYYFIHLMDNRKPNSKIFPL